MTEIDRRKFLKIISITAAGVGTLGTSALVSACSSDSDSKSTKNRKEVFDDGELVALSVSSDIYLTDLSQRIAFTIFNQNREVMSDGSVDVELVSPSNKTQEFKKVSIREDGIKGNGIYSVMAKLDEVGAWTLKTNFQDQALELAFNVKEKNTAPALESACPDSTTPTNADPLDAAVLCTRFDGECGLHKKSVSELLDTKKPFVVIFATPARCQTSYCGPVLDLAREVASTSSIPVIHIEIYKNETTIDTLDAVTKWNLASEPWMFGVTSEGKIDSRLDGAFDKSEIEDLFTRLT